MLAWWTSATSRARCSVSSPSASEALSITKWITASVGTMNVPRSSISAISSAVTNEACSTVSTPPRTALRMLCLAVGVGGDALALRVRQRGDDRHLLLAVLLGVRPVAGADHAAGDHQLEQVGAVVELRPGGLPHAVGALGVQPDVPAVAVRPGDPRAGGEDARPGRGARGDRVAQLEAERRHAADLARRRDAVPEQRRGALCRAPQLVHMRQVDGVVERVRGGVEGEVGMRVDEAGDRGRPSRVELLAVGCRGRGRSRRSARRGCARRRRRGCRRRRR